MAKTKKSIFGNWQKLVIVLTALSFIYSAWVDYVFWSNSHMLLPVELLSQWELPMMIFRDLFWISLVGIFLFIVTLMIPITSPFQRKQTTLAFWK